MNYLNGEYNGIVRKISIISNTLFLLTHIGYLLLFLYNTNLDKDFYVLVFINCFSISFYAALYIVLKFKLLTLFAYLSGIEITIYMSVLTILCGFGNGFELCLIGLTILGFYASYFSRLRDSAIKPIPIGLTFMIVYMILFVVSYNVTPICPPSDGLHILLIVSHSSIVFIFIIFFMSVLLRYIVKLEKNIIKENEIDNLTQIYNRNALDSYFNNLEDKSKYLCSIFDIDSFKDFNDKNGHLCGDYVLKEIAKLAKENSSNDFVARWGGEEFVLISLIENNIDNTIKKIDAIRKKVEEYDFIYKNKHLKSTITIGVSEYKEGDTLDQWISKSDKKLYKGKNSGKNKTVY